jgi:hypothetical protein
MVAGNSTPSRVPDRRKPDRGRVRPRRWATGEIDRKDFIITTNIPIDSGGAVIGDTTQLFIEMAAILQQPAEA